MIITVRIDIDATLIFCLILLTFVLLLYACCDLNYYLTYGFIVTWCTLRRKPIKIDDTTEYYGVCTTNDLDIYFNHMNNARYMREVDFARFHFYQRVGFYDYLIKAGGASLHTAAHIRYRRPIHLFTFYKVTTKVIYWDEKNIYLEHQFVILNDGFITTVILSKQTIVGAKVVDMMNTILDKDRDESFLPKPPPELEDFIELNKKSSQRLRKK